MLAYSDIACAWMDMPLRGADGPVSVIGVSQRSRRERESLRSRWKCERSTKARQRLWVEERRTSGKRVSPNSRLAALSCRAALLGRPCCLLRPCR